MTTRVSSLTLLGLAPLCLIATSACRDSLSRGDLGPAPQAAFYSPQAIAASDRLVLVGSTGFHFEGRSTAWDKGFITFVDRQTRQIVTRLQTTQLNPQAIAVRENMAFVVNSGTLAVGQDGVGRVTSDGGIDLIDLSAPVPRLVGNIPLGRSAADGRIGDYGSIVLDASGSVALVGSGTRGDLFQIDLVQRRVLRGPKDPLVLFPTPPGENGLSMVRSLGSGEMAALSFNTDELCVSATWDRGPVRWTCGAVGVQDRLLEGPIDVARAPDGQLLVLMTLANSVYRVNTARQPFVVDHTFAKTGLAANRLLVRGDHAYVLNTMSSNLERVSLETGRADLPFAVLPLGSKPYDMVVTREPEGEVAWITLNGSHALALVSLETGALISTLSSSARAADGGRPDSRPPDARPCLEGVIGVGNLVEVTYGPGAGEGQDKLPAVIQGGPRGSGPTSGSTDVLSLGVGGALVVDFGAFDIVDGPGPDFIVFENPFLVAPYESFAEPALVSASESSKAPSSFTSFPCDLEVPHGDPSVPTWPYPGCAGVRPGSGPCLSTLDPLVAGGDPFDLHDIGLERARYLRLQDAGRLQTGTTTKGFDLDAIVLIHHEKR